MAKILLLSLLLMPTFARGAAPASQPYEWKSVQIVGGGFVSGIITHPKAKDVIYCRTDVGGAYRWDAGAKQWIAITDWISGEDWNFTGIESLAIDPSNPDRVYLACGTYTNNWAPTNGAIFRSHDRGRTWKRADMPFKMGGNEDGRSNGERLAVDPRDANVIFFGSRTAGLWKSSDGAATWTQVKSFPEVATGDTTMSGRGGRAVGIPVVVFHPTKRDVYAAVSTPEPSIFRSGDGGETWQPVQGQPTGFKPSHAVFDDAGNLYVTYGNGPGPNGITDGALWKLDTAAGKWADISPIKPSKEDQFGYGGVSVDARNPGATIVASTMDRWARKDNIFRSTDGGKTWAGMFDQAQWDHATAPYTKTSNPHWIGDVELDPFDPDRVLFVTGYGIWASRNATTTGTGKPVQWAFDSRGIEECVINEIISPPKGAPLLNVMWDLDGFRHDDLDVSPAHGRFEPHFGKNTGIDFAENAPEHMVRVFAAREGPRGAFSSDGGVTWKPFEASAPGNGEGTIALSADAKSAVWTPAGGAPHFCDDKFAKWQPCKGLGEDVRVVSDRAVGATFYAFDRRAGALFASTDGGATFTARAGDLPKSEGFLRAVPAHAGHLWLAGDAGLLRSSDGGKTFAKITGVDKGRRIGFGKAAPGKSYPSIFLVGTLSKQYGFYRSDDEGKSWVRINDDDHQFGTINTVTGDPRVHGRVYVGSANRGILYGEPATDPARPARAGR